METLTFAGMNYELDEELDGSLVYRKDIYTIRLTSLGILEETLWEVFSHAHKLESGSAASVNSAFTQALIAMSGYLRNKDGKVSNDSYASGKGVGVQARSRQGFRRLPR